MFTCMSLCHSIPFTFFPPEGQNFIFFTFTSLANYYLFNNAYIPMMLGFFPHLGYVSQINLSYRISYFSYVYIYTMCSWLGIFFFHSLLYMELGNVGLHILKHKYCTLFIRNLLQNINIGWRIEHIYHYQY